MTKVSVKDNSTKCLHVLVIPSEEFVPERAPLAGIFQYHQLHALAAKTDYKMGVLSIRLSLSIWMLLRAIAFRSLGLRVPKELSGKSVMGLTKLLIDKLFYPERFVSLRNAEGYSVVDAEGFYYLPPSPRFDYIGWVRAGMFAFEAYVHQFGKPDVIHAHNALFAGLLAARIHNKTRIPYVLTEHSSYYYQNLIPAALYRKIRGVVHGARTTITVSRALRTSMVEKLGEFDDSLVLPNVLPASFEKQGIGAEIDNASSDYLFLCVGNFLPIKGQEILIDAFIKIAALSPTASLTLVGDGPTRDRLTLKVREHGLDDRVKFTGLCTADEVRQWMLKSDVLVLPSRFETFGVVLIEALACGIPVLATTCGGPNDIITECDGVLVEPDSVEAMTSGMMSMLRGGRYDREDLRKQAISRFGASSFVKKISTIYERAIADENSQR